MAGPLAGQVLADLGAEVIKIEAPGGEAARHITAVLPGRPPLATYFLPNNRGKKSVTADLTTDEAKQQILRLADTADVVLEGFRPGVMERLGLGPNDLQSRNPKLIYARLSAFGGNGPHGTRPGVDLMVAAEAGMSTGMPTPTGKPQIIPFQLVDNASGHVLAQAVLAALLNRERHGVADVVRVAMYDVAVGLQANQLTMHLNKSSEAPKPPSRMPHQIRRSARELGSPLSRQTHSRPPTDISSCPRISPSTGPSCAKSSAGPTCWTTSDSSTNGRGRSITTS